MFRVGAAALACAAAVVSAGCGGSNKESSAAAELARAAGASRNATAAFTIEMTLRLPDAPSTIVRIRGVVDSRTGRSRSTQSEVKNGGERLMSRTIIVDGAVYVAAAGGPSGLTHGKRWLEAPAVPTNGGERTTNVADPTTFVASLQATARSVKRRGTAIVAGVPTIAYDLVVDLDAPPPATLPARDRRRLEAAFAEMLGETHRPRQLISVWVDAQHRLRRERFVPAARLARRATRKPDVRPRADRLRRFRRHQATTGLRRLLAAVTG